MVFQNHCVVSLTVFILDLQKCLKEVTTLKIFGARCFVSADQHAEPAIHCRRYKTEQRKHWKILRSIRSIRRHTYDIGICSMSHCGNRKTDIIFMPAENVGANSLAIALENSFSLTVRSKHWASMLNMHRITFCVVNRSDICKQVKFLMIYFLCHENGKELKVTLQFENFFYIFCIHIRIWIKRFDIFDVFTTNTVHRGNGAFQLQKNEILRRISTRKWLEITCAAHSLWLVKTWVKWLCVLRATHRLVWKMD